MARLTGKDYRDVLNLVYLANRCEDVESFINTLLPSIIKVFHTECITFHLIKGYLSHTEIVESRSFKSDSHSLYEDKYYPTLYQDSFYQHSPLLTEALSSSKIALKLGDYISLQDWESSVLYNGLIRPQHLYWELFLTLRWKNNLVGMITLWRSRQQPDYEDSDVLKAEMLAPHLGVAVHNICLLSRINARERNILFADETDGEGIIWLDHEFSPSFFNAEARNICLQLLSRVPGNTYNPGTDEFPIPSYVIKDCSELLDLNKAQERPVLLPKERTVSTENGKKFRIESSLIWKADRVNPKPNFVVTLSDLSDERKQEANLQAKFNLSNRELDVVYYLTKGLSDDEIAGKLYISNQTVHTHIKNIYKKLGAKSRIELFQRVINSSYLGMFEH
jgi:DNA-binding CsgD family transcriptional regulator